MYKMGRHSLEANAQPEYREPAEGQLARGSDFYLDQARRVDQLSHATTFSEGQGADLAQQLRNRASEAPNSLAVSLSGDPMSVEDERDARDKIYGLITHASHFLDTDPRLDAPGLDELFDQRMPLDSSVTATVMNEAEAIFKAEPTGENGKTFRTGIDGLTMHYDDFEDPEGKKYVGVRLERGPRTAQASETRSDLTTDPEPERTSRVARLRRAIRGLRGPKSADADAKSVPSSDDEAWLADNDPATAFALPTQGKHHKRNPEMDHSTGSYYGDLARQVRNITVRNSDSVALVSNIEQRSARSSEKFLPDQDPAAERQVRLGVEEVT